MKRLATLAFALSLSLAGCSAHTTVKNLPPNVTDQQVNSWINATTNLQNAQTATHSAVQAAIGLNKRQVIPDSSGYTTALAAMGHAEQLEIEAAEFLKTVPKDWSQSTRAKILTYTQQIINQLEAANTQGVLGVKDPTTGQAVSTLLINVSKIMLVIQGLASGGA